MIDKAALRAEMRLRRKALADTTPWAGEGLAAHASTILNLHEAAAPVIAFYCPQGSEIDPTALAHALIERGARLALPVVVDRAAPLIFRAWTPDEPLEEDLAGCPSPLELAEVVTPDVILTPLIAFDARGGRLGQGGGYYDRTFQALRDRSPRPRLIGLAFAGQEVGRLPMESHDQPLDGVLTESGYRAFA
ncbi:MAG: 5-formyltetrahydrofolate cyclo-ligase [Brevundimonas sp.]